MVRYPDSYQLAALLLCTALILAGGAGLWKLLVRRWYFEAAAGLLALAMPAALAVATLSAFSAHEAIRYVILGGVPILGCFVYAGFALMSIYGAERRVAAINPPRAIVPSLRDRLAISGQGRRGLRRRVGAALTFVGLVLLLVALTIGGASVPTRAITEIVLQWAGWGFLLSGLYNGVLVGILAADTSPI